MNRINIEGFKDINDITVQNLILRDKLNVFEYCGWRHEIESTQNIYTGTYEENLKLKISTPKGFFLNGNIVLNDASSLLQSGSLTLKSIHLTLNENNRSLYNILGVPKIIKKITLTQSVSHLLDTYIFKDNTLIGEVIDLKNDDTNNIHVLYVECYYSSYSSNESILTAANKLQYSDSKNGIITELLNVTQDNTYVFSIHDRTTYPPSFKEVNLVSKMFNNKIYLDIGNSILLGDTSSNKIDVLDLSATTIEATTIHAKLHGDTEGHHLGDVSGNTEGHHMGDVSGNTEGHHMGDVSGNTEGHHMGDVSGNTEGHHMGDVSGNTEGHHMGDVSGNTEGHHKGDVSGNTEGHHTGDVSGNTEGHHTGDVSGNTK